MFQIRNVQDKIRRFGHLRFEFRSLFRISTFGFRIFAATCHKISLCVQPPRYGTQLVPYWGEENSVLDRTENQV